MLAVVLGRRIIPSSVPRWAARRRLLPMIETAKLNGVDPQAWLADTLARLPDHKINRIDKLLPWSWRQ